jgi:predicted  nucleic acid-binding Zn-ribbon protein
MAQIEYEGLKVSGTKWLIIFPLIGTIIGGLWGGFELYKRYEDMEQTISQYKAPDLSGFDKRIEVMETLIKEQRTTITTEIGALKELVADAQETARDIRTDIKGEVMEQTDQISAIDKRSRADGLEVRQTMRSAEKEIRELINTTDKRWSDKLSKVDTQIENLETKLDRKITKALENPLAAMSKTR